MEVIKQLYKGFIETKGKRPKVKLEPENFKPLEDVINADSFAGILREDVVVIDIDDEPSSELVMNIIEENQVDCYVYQTDRGRHFIFKNYTLDKCKTKTKIALGLEADIKVGTKIVPHALKVDGRERFLEWECDYDNLSEVPKWLYPIKTSIDLLNLSEGEGRNDVLYRYILDLCRHGLSKEEARTTLEIINKYIFKDSLPQRELDTIMRDDAFPEETFFKGSKLLHDEFAKFILNNDNVKRINGQLHIYDGSVYVAGYRAIESRMVKYIPTLTKTQRRETLDYLEILCPDDAKSSGVNLIAFNNGIYDINTGTLTDFSPDVILTNKIPHNYSPTAYDYNVDSVLDKLSCNDKTIRAILEEAVGYSFYRRNELSKAFIFTGNRANGKSTFLAMLECCLGESNYTSLDVAELDDRFSTVMLSSKLANIGDDIGDGYLQGKAVSMFKKITSGNTVKAEFKGQDAFVFKPYTKLFFSTNDMAQMKDPTGAVLRRLVIIPMNATFTKDSPDYDPYIISKLTTESAMEYLITLAIEGLKRVLDKHEFTKSEAAEIKLSEYEESNDHFLEWLNQNEIDEDYMTREPVATIFRNYNVWCVESGYEQWSTTRFGSAVRNRFGLKSKVRKIDGKPVRFYAK